MYFNRINNTHLSLAETKPDSGITKASCLPPFPAVFAGRNGAKCTVHKLCQSFLAPTAPAVASLHFCCLQKMALACFLRVTDSEIWAEVGRRGRLISTIFMLVIVLNELVTMVTFICRFALLFPGTDHPPPKKIAPVGC